MKNLTLLILVLLYTATILNAQEPKGHWAFDNVRSELKELKMVRGETFLPKERFGYVLNSVNNVESDLNGKFFKQVKGVKGGAVLLDGNTAFIEVGRDDVPRVEGDFSVEAWIAMGAYPNNVSPIVDNQRDPAEGYYNGYFFGLDALGRLILRIATDGQDELVISTQRIPIEKWTHVAGTYSPEKGLNIYIDGKLAASKMPDGLFTPAQQHVTILIGKSRAPARPYGTIRPYGTQPYYMYYDGLLDDIKIYDTELSAEVISKTYSSVDANTPVELPDRTMPTGPLKAEWFGAVNTNLEYYEAWDAPWHVDRGTDVIVRFDNSPVEFVFWKGLGYNTALVTENGLWFTNGFNEGWNQHGSCEPMSDKQTRHSHVKVLEANDARVVVQWRYALIDNWNEFAFYDESTRWGDCTNETYFIYPDMVSVREDVLLSNAPRAQHEWQESMVVPGPGQTPEDLLNKDALTLGNIKGEYYTYSWEHETPPHFPPSPKNPNMQWVNMKSEWKPFSILRSYDNPSIDVYSGEIRREISVFPWWNHWPVAQKPTDGRFAMAADRPAHSSLSHWFWDHYKVSDNSMTKLMLTGLTNKKAEELLPLNRSWENAPKVTASGSTKVEYNMAERAFDVWPEDGADEITLSIAANVDSPLYNPAFVIHAVGSKNLAIEINGDNISRGKKFRFGHNPTLDNVDIVSWVEFQSDKKTEIKLTIK